MTEFAPTFTPNPEPPEELERAIDEAEADVKRCEQSILDASSLEAEQAAREALTRAELRLYELLDRRADGCGCEGWPRGK